MGSRTVQIYNFPLAAALGIKQWLEEHTGNGTIYALKIRQTKEELKFGVYAIVQFTTSKCAEAIIIKASKRKLWYSHFLLRARHANYDIIPEPRVWMFSSEHISIHFGCQISDERFSVLWSGEDVQVRFGLHMQKLYFFLSWRGVWYNLELFYESIRQIQLRRPSGRDTEFLLIQMQAAPRIYKKIIPNSARKNDGPSFNYFKDAPDNQWVRSTDFTPSCCIGQSSTLCLKLPNSCIFPDIGEYFIFYKENQAQFVLESGSSFSHSLDLVPIVGPHRGFELPYSILFKINSLVQNGIIMGPTLTDDFFRLVNPNSVSYQYIRHALENLTYLKDSCFDPVKWLREQYQKYESLDRLPISSTISLEHGSVYVHRVLVTPCKVYFRGPDISISNRVVRNYTNDIDNFLRVSFVDEEWERLWSMDLSNRGEHNRIHERVLSTLKNGIVIGNKKFEFLAFSASQLRESSTWMFASRDGLNAAAIRKWMGDFSGIRNVAKFAARMGQSFGSSTETEDVGRHEIEILRDIKVVTNRAQYIFSDGIGKMSADFARIVWKKCHSKCIEPSAFQIRYGGYKGVVAVDPTSRFKLSLRNSMCKYKSENTKLDVLSWSRYQPCFLNRQVITLLSTLGVKDHVFEMLQKKAVEQLNSILVDPERAQEALEAMYPGEHNKFLREMLKDGYKPDSEPFLLMMLQTFQASMLLQLRTKARIFVPEGRVMMGCLDETRTLEYGQVFVNISSIGCEKFYSNATFRSLGVTGKVEVVVAKNPCLHPGDVRILTAVDVPALYHMVDCIVFPQRGKRPHPNECSGRDLDGDLYFVSWDPNLIPPRQVSPMEYVAPPAKILDRDVEIEDVMEYFTNYILNDSLGIISNAHVDFADKEPLMAESKSCIELAKLFSIAVDYPKTGVPANIPPHLQPKEFPDFMEKPDKPTYISERVIGKLFRAIKDITPSTTDILSFTREGH